MPIPGLISFTNNNNRDTCIKTETSKLLCCKLCAEEGRPNQLVKRMRLHPNSHWSRQYTLVEPAFKIAMRGHLFFCPRHGKIWHSRNVFLPNGFLGIGTRFDKCIEQVFEHAWVKESAEMKIRSKM